MSWLWAPVVLVAAAVALVVGIWQVRLARFARGMRRLAGFTVSSWGSDVRLGAKSQGVDVEICLSPWWLSTDCFHCVWVGSHRRIGDGDRDSIVSVDIARSDAKLPYEGCEVVDLGLETDLVCHRSPYDDSRVVRSALGHPSVLAAARALLDAGAAQASVFGGRVYVPFKSDALNPEACAKETELAIDLWRAIVNASSGYR